MNTHLLQGVRDFYHRLRYPKCKIGAGCHISRDSFVAEGTVLSEQCRVSGATILEKCNFGPRCVLGPETKIAVSVLGPAVILEHGAQIFNSSLDGWSSLQRGTELTQAHLGAYSYVARETVLNDVRIGKFCSIGPRCLIGTGDHPTDRVTTSPVFYSTRRQAGVSFAEDDQFLERRPVCIGSDVWLGAGVFVRDGVSIGHGAIVGAGAVVTADVAPYTIVGGVPARQIRARCSAEMAGKLVDLAWWDWSVERLKKARPWLASGDFEKFFNWAEDQGNPFHPEL